MKFSGAVGYETLVEVRPSNWQSVIVERKYRGDANRVSRRLQQSDKVNDDIVVSNEIEILADAFDCRMMIWLHFPSMQMIW